MAGQSHHKSPELEARHAMNQLQICAEQLAAVHAFFGELAGYGQRLTYVEELAA